MNFITDIALQPIITGLIELTLWQAIFASASSNTIGGFTKEYYLSYVLWAAFVSRITTNWMYEMRMTEEIDSGSINGLLVRPMSFFEYYLSQLLGYKFATSVFSLLIPFAFCYAMNLPVIYSRFIPAFLLIGYYLIFTHVLSFCVSSVAFHLNRTHSLTTAKNLALWLLSGELVPLDLLPEPYRHWILALPFCNAVFIPVGYLTGRLNEDVILNGFFSVTIGIVIFSFVAHKMWNWGLSKYTGTGA